MKKEIIPIDCKEAVKRFNDFLDNYLKGKARQELVYHISGCRHCLDHLEFEQMLKAKIASLGNSSSLNKKQAEKHIEKILSKL